MSGCYFIKDNWDEPITAKELGSDMVKNGSYKVCVVIGVNRYFISASIELDDGCYELSLLGLHPCSELVDTRAEVWKC